MSKILSFNQWNSINEGASFNFDPSGEYPDKTFGLPEGGVNSAKVFKGGKNGDWGGSMQRALAFAKVANDFMGKNIISSQKRSTQNTANGNVSDHYQGNDVSYAVDLGCSVADGDKILAELMKWVGFPQYKGGNWFNFVIDGYRYQVGWRVPNHFDHIHIGVEKVEGQSDTPGREMVPQSKTPGNQVQIVKKYLRNKSKDANDSSGEYKSWQERQEEEEEEFQRKFQKYKDSIKAKKS